MPSSASTRRSPHVNAHVDPAHMQVEKLRNARLNRLKKVNPHARNRTSTAWILIHPPSRISCVVFSHLLRRLRGSSRSSTNWGTAPTRRLTWRNSLQRAEKVHGNVLARNSICMHFHRSIIVQVRDLGAPCRVQSRRHEPEQ